MARTQSTVVGVHDRSRVLDHVASSARSDTLTANILAASTRTYRRSDEFRDSSADASSDPSLAFDVERGEGTDENRDRLADHRTLKTSCLLHLVRSASDAFVGSSKPTLRGAT